MHAKLRTKIVVAAGAAAGLLGAFACQNYQFDPVKPSTVIAHTNFQKMQSRREKPFIMLVVDTSGSMLEPADASGASCDDGTNHFDGSTKRCKWNDLRDAFANTSTGFLTTAGELAHFGLTHFPNASGGNSCNTGEIVQRLDANNTNANVVRQKLDALSPYGGTPTSATLQAVLQQEALLHRSGDTDERDRFVMLLTDGMPNCASSPDLQSRCDACKDASSCDGIGKCQPTYSPYTSCDSPTKCLDEDATVAAVKALKDAKVDTFVIGFGAGTASGNAARVLNEAAVAGGRPRSEATKYYQAANRDELRSVLEDITAAVQPCKFSLDPAPMTESAVQVVFRTGTDVETPPAQLPTCPAMKDGFCALAKDVHWQFVDAKKRNVVEILDAPPTSDGTRQDYCTLIQNPDPASNTALSFYTVEKLE